MLIPEPPVEIKTKIKSHLYKKLKQRKISDLDEFINAAVGEKLFRESTSLLDKVETLPRTGKIKIATRLTVDLNDRLKNKKNLAFHTKESFIDEAIREKLNRVDFFNSIQFTFEKYLDEIRNEILDSLNSGEANTLLEEFNSKLEKIRPSLDAAELQAIIIQHEYILKEFEDKAKIIYLVALNQDVSRNPQTRHLISELVDTGFLLILDDLTLQLDPAGISQHSDFSF